MKKIKQEVSYLKSNDKSSFTQAVSSKICSQISKKLALPQHRAERISELKYALRTTPEILSDYDAFK